MGFVILTMPEIFTINVFVDHPHFWRQATFSFKGPKNKKFVNFFKNQKVIHKTFLKVKFGGSKGKNYFYNLLNV